MRAIIFDKDGTLMAFDPFWTVVTDAALSMLAARLGATQYEEEMKRTIGLDGGVIAEDSMIRSGTYAQAADAINEALQGHGFPARTTEAELAELFAKCADRGVILPTCEGIPELLEKLQDEGYLLFVVTTDTPAITQRCLDDLEISRYFCEVITDNGSFPAKPDPGVLHYLMEKYSLSAENVWMVGDTDTDIRFARNGGIAAIRVGERGSSACPEDMLIRDVTCLRSLIVP